MSRPEEIFKKARRQRRKIIYHMGLTNSGKTYQAYQALKKAKTGVYLAPLRLLAWEIHQKLNNDGVKCDLVTGQERIRHNVKATHLSSTIECLNYQNQYDVCVIDEIQLISDEYRGNAWTQAVLGANSKEIHICGDDRAYSLIKYMAEQTADQLIINRHKRLSTLHVHKKEFKLRDIQDGDCLICFGRTNLLKMVQQINKMKKSKCCAAIYGKLPPEVRKRQAGRFNRRQNGIKYMVASDAIGMGLNLSIKRIIFCQLKKQNNNKVYDLIDSYTIKQIAGRAGRYHNDGYVLTKDEQYIKYIDFSVQNNDINKLIEDSPFKSVNKELSLKQACLFPTYQQIVEFIDLVQDNFDTQRATFYKVFLLFQQNQKSDTKYFIQNAQSFQTRAEFLSDLDLDTIDAYNFCQAPLQSDNDSEMQKLHDLGRQFVKYNKVKLPKHLRSSKYYDHSLIDMQNLKMFEQMYQELSLYQWLFYKYQTAFVDIHLCNKRIKQIDEIIDRILQ